MPRYVYVCKKCEKEFNVAHSIADKLIVCYEADEECNLSGSLERRPSSFFTTSNIQNNEKIGDVVKNSIKDFKEDLRAEKQQLANEDYKEND